jgi:hypothetical protein
MRELARIAMDLQSLDEKRGQTPLTVLEDLPGKR